MLIQRQLTGIMKQVPWMIGFDICNAIMLLLSCVFSGRSGRPLIVSGWSVVTHGATSPLSGGGSCTWTGVLLGTPDSSKNHYRDRIDKTCGLLFKGGFTFFLKIYRKWFVLIPSPCNVLHDQCCFVLAHNMLVKFEAYKLWSHPSSQVLSTLKCDMTCPCLRWMMGVRRWSSSNAKPP